MQIEVRQTDVFAAWFAGLRDREARARITARIRRLSLGNAGDVKPVGGGVSEMRIDYGAGYRVYICRARRLGRDSALRLRQADSGSRYQARRPAGAGSIEDDMARKTRRWDAAETLDSK